MLNNLKMICHKIFAPKINITGSCLLCGKCCKNLILTYKNKPVTDKKQFAALVKKQSFYARFTPINTSESNNIIYFTCTYLENNKCRDHQHRPSICQKYPSPQMFKKGGQLLSGCGYKINLNKNFNDYLK